MKVVVEEVPGWLRVHDDGSVDRTWTGPPEVEFLVTPYHPSPEEALHHDGVALHDITVPAPFNLSLRLYLPATAKNDDGRVNKLPVLLHFHGGGFCVTRPTWYMYYQFYSPLATKLHAAVVSVSTRPAPEHRLPAAIDDCYSALLWLRSLARSDESAVLSDVAGLRDMVDFPKVFLIGESSGGNLVHEVAARAGREVVGFWSPLMVEGGIPIHPGFVRSNRSRSELEGEPGPFLTLEIIDKLLALALPEGSTKDHPYTCPMGEAAPPMEGLNMPAMMVAVAEGDLMKDREMEYCEAMKEAGKEVEVVVNVGVGHCFYLNKIAVDHDPRTAMAAEELMEAVKVFVDRH